MTDAPAFILRDPQPGDLGYVVHRQALLYAQEYGWNAEFEALVIDYIEKRFGGKAQAAE